MRLEKHQEVKCGSEAPVSQIKISRQLLKYIVLNYFILSLRPRTKWYWFHCPVPVHTLGLGTTVINMIK